MRRGLGLPGLALVAGALLLPSGAVAAELVLRLLPELNMRRHEEPGLWFEQSARVFPPEGKPWLLVAGIPKAWMILKGESALPLVVATHNAGALAALERGLSEAGLLSGDPLVLAGRGIAVLRPLDPRGGGGVERYRRIWEIWELLADSRHSDTLSVSFAVVQWLQSRGIPARLARYPSPSGERFGVLLPGVQPPRNADWAFAAGTGALLPASLSAPPLAGLTPDRIDSWSWSEVLAPGWPRGTGGLRWARIFDDGRPHPARADASSTVLRKAWPFCPTDRIPCAEEDLAWVEVGISVDTYNLRRSDPHASIKGIVEGTHEDLAPLAAALWHHFATADLQEDTRRIAFVQGLVQAIVYNVDEVTGWTEYPRFGIELLADAIGDCDDAAIAAAALLQSLGYRTWFVRWGGSDAGHLSLALSPDRGDLAAASPPGGSHWIIAPDGQRLLPVEVTGAAAGCGRPWMDCSVLGWNQWADQGLTVQAVAAVDDPGLAVAIPLSAWSNGGLIHPQASFVDRRAATDVQVERELFERRDGDGRVLRRLTSLGIDRESRDRYLRAGVTQTGVAPGVLSLYYGSCAAILAMLAGMAWRRWKDRMQRAHQEAGRRLERRL